MQERLRKSVLLAAIISSACFLALPAYSADGPVIANITISKITSTAATISCNTDISAYCKIEYGETISYGISTSYPSRASTSSP